MEEVELRRSGKYENHTLVNCKQIVNTQSRMIDKNGKFSIIIYRSEEIYYE